MARQSGLFNFEGTLDNVTFYKTADGLLVRKKGGVSKNRLLHDPAFIRARENGAEFGNCAKSAGKLRKSVSMFVYMAKDSKLSSRLIKVFFVIKKYDSLNVRGERSVGQGLTTSLGKSTLKGFDFNRNAKWHTIVPSPYVLDTVTGTVTIADFNPSEHLNFPDGATHFSLQNAFLHIDLTTGAYEILYSDLFNYPISNAVINPTLVPSGIPTASGTKLYLVLIEFFQEVNGIQYALNNGAFNALTILDVL
ncbi:hypothetical protein [Flavobacterium sp.]|uniref:hypothetical protein n=1 Tax=Flavobacterium sp. TaxID=239 RepID=UPI0037523FB6